MPAPPSILAPGRVNLIGEHTDYSGGLVLPVAVDRGVTVQWRPDAQAIRLRSAAFPETVVELAPDGTPAQGLAGWGRYAAAVAALLTERGRPAVGLDGWVTSTVPIGAGLSSSAALTVAVGLALCRAAGFELSQLQLAHVCREAEYRAVGVPVGLMDPAVCLLARRGHALLLDCATDEHRLIPLPESLAVVVLDSGVRHQLEHSGYATRRAELERALPALERAQAPRRSRWRRRKPQRGLANVDEIALAGYATSSPRTSACGPACACSSRRTAPTDARWARSSATRTRAFATISRSPPPRSTSSSNWPTITVRSQRA